MSERETDLNGLGELVPRSEPARKRILENVHAIAVATWKRERVWVLEDGREKTARIPDLKTCLDCQKFAAQMLGVDTPTDATTGKAKFIPPWQRTWPEAGAS